jgi:hypothetical protein
MLVTRLNGIASPAAALRCKDITIVEPGATARLSGEQVCGRVEALRQEPNVTVRRNGLKELRMRPKSILHMKLCSLIGMAWLVSKVAKSWLLKDVLQPRGLHIILI